MFIIFIILNYYFLEIIFLPHFSYILKLLLENKVFWNN